MADPEIQMIICDSILIQLLRYLQENPSAGQTAFTDPTIMAKIQKLIAAGVIKMGWVQAIHKRRNSVKLVLNQPFKIFSITTINQILALFLVNLE